MSAAKLTGLGDVLEFRQTLTARPPRLAGASLALVAALVASAVVWAGLTTTDLVVQAPARVRPAGGPATPLEAPCGDAVKAEAGGRVMEVLATEGLEVAEGDPLVRISTERIVNEIARLSPTIDAGREELTRLEKLRDLLIERCDAEAASTAADLAQAETDLGHQRKVQEAEARVAEAEAARAEVDALRALKERDADVRRLEAEVDKTMKDESRARELVGVGAIAAVESENATAKSRDAKERLSRAKVEPAAAVEEARRRLERARIPPDESRVECARSAVEAGKRDAAYRKEELAVRFTTRAGEIAAAERSLANLELELRQAVVRAPSAGVVTEVRVKPGDIVERGAVVAVVAGSRGFRIDVAVAASDVALIAPGMKARVKIDAWDFRKYGAIDGIVRRVGTDARIEQAGAGRAAVYLVTIEIDSPDFGRNGLRATLKMGMTGSAEIVTGTEGMLAVAFRKFKDKVATR